MVYFTLEYYNINEEFLEFSRIKANITELGGNAFRFVMSMKYS